MPERSSSGPRDQARFAGPSSASSSTAQWSAIRGEIEAIVESVLSHAFATAGRLAMETIARAEREGLARLVELEERRARLEAELEQWPTSPRAATPSETVDRREFDQAERQAARELAERQAAGIVAAARREAEQLLEKARREAADVERQATEQQAAILAESQDLELQLRELDERLGRLFSAGHADDATPPAAATATAQQPGPATDVPWRSESSAAAGVEYADDARFEAGVRPTGGTDREPEGRPPDATASETRAGAEAAGAAAPALEVGEPGSPEEGESGGADLESAPVPLAITSTAAADLPRVPADEPSDEVPVEAETAMVQLVFHAVPGFQAALSLERALKALPGLQQVRVADFNERRLTFQVTHALGPSLPDAVLDARAGELELIEAGPERAEFRFRG